MATPQIARRNYVLGNSLQEQERLKLQANIVGRWTDCYSSLPACRRG